MGATHLGQDDPALMIHGMPSPSLLLLVFHKTPHVIDLCFVHLMNLDFHIFRVAIQTHVWLDGLPCWRFFFILA